MDLNSTSKVLGLSDFDLEYVVEVLREAEEQSHAERYPGPPTLRHVLAAFSWLISRSSPEKPNEDAIYQFLLQMSGLKESSWWHKLDVALQVWSKKLRRSVSAAGG